MSAIGRGVKGALYLPIRFLRWSVQSRWRLLGLTILIFGGVLAGSFKAYEFWSSPAFCTSCHHMAPYVASWKRSSHNKVACVKCHFEPGLNKELHGKWVAVKQLASTVTGAYSSMPYAEVSDASCLRSGCHEKTKWQQPIKFTDREVRFDHKSHLNEVRLGLKLNCTSCHFQRLTSTHIEVDKSTCFLCHFNDARDQTGKDIGACDTCHGPPEDAREAGRFVVKHANLLDRGMTCTQCHVEVKKGNGQVSRTRCISCHNTPEQLAAYNDPIRVHEEHVKLRKRHCHECHDLIDHEFKASDPEEKHKDCGDCHEEPHSPQAMLYAGKGARGVAPLGNDMHMVGLDCVACHKDLGDPSHGDITEGGQLTHLRGPRGGIDACNDCHPPSYRKVAIEMRQTFLKMQDHLLARLDRVDTAIQARVKRGGKVSRKVFKAVRDTKSNLGFVRDAHAAHNPQYAARILRAGDRRLAEAERALDIEGIPDRPEGFKGQTCVICHEHVRGTDASDRHEPIAAGACTVCHSDHTTGSADRPKRDGWAACVTCHEERIEKYEDHRHRHMPVGQDCGLCHEPHTGSKHSLLKFDAKTICTNCHEASPGAQGAVYHEALNQADACHNCHSTHDSKFPKLLKKPVAQLCLACHDEPQERPDGSKVPAIGEKLKHSEHLHGPITQGDCTGCHDPHGTDAPKNLRENYTDKFFVPYDPKNFKLCFRCHEERVFETQKTKSLTGFRNGDTNLHFVHVNDGVKGRTCRVCHETHGSSIANHIKATVPYADWDVKVNFEKRSTGGACTPGCHVKREYDYFKAIPVAQDLKKDGAGKMVFPIKRTPKKQGAGK